MSNELKPELSARNPYWLERHRYYELKHFCLQYPCWQKTLSLMDGYSGESRPVCPTRGGTLPGDPTHTAAEARAYCLDRIEMVKRAAMETDEVLGNYILLAVTHGYSYNTMSMRHNLPCCRETWYALYRRFFWTLSGLRN